MQKLFLLNFFPRHKKFTGEASQQELLLPTQDWFFSHFPHTLPSSATKAWLQATWKKTNIDFSTIASFPKIEKCLLAIVPSWQIYNQGVTQGRKATRKHISLALEMHLLITNTEFAKSPYYYLSHTTITSGKVTQKKLMKKNSGEIKLTFDHNIWIVV